MLSKFMEDYNIPLVEDDDAGSANSQGSTTSLGQVPTVGLGVVSTNYQPDLIVNDSTGRDSGSEKDIDQGLCMKCGRPLFNNLCYFCNHLGDAQQMAEVKKPIIVEVSKLRKKVLG